MGVKQVTVYQYRCEGCGKTVEGPDYTKGIAPNGKWLVLNVHPGTEAAEAKRYDSCSFKCLAAWSAKVGDA